MVPTRAPTTMVAKLNRLDNLQKGKDLNEPGFFALHFSQKFSTDGIILLCVAKNLQMFSAGITAVKPRKNMSNFDHWFIFSMQVDVSWLALNTKCRACQFPKEYVSSPEVVPATYETLLSIKIPYWQLKLGTFVLAGLHGNNKMTSSITWTIPTKCEEG